MIKCTSQSCLCIGVLIGIVSYLYRIILSIEYLCSLNRKSFFKFKIFLILYKKVNSITLK